MPLSDTTKRKFDVLIGIGSADEIVSLAGDAITADSPTLTSPTLVGTILVGGTTDSIGFFGAAPLSRPAGADQVAAPLPTAVPLTYVGVPDQELGDSGDINENNRLACLAAQINNLISDLDTVRTLVNRLRTDLVDLGLIQGAASRAFTRIRHHDEPADTAEAKSS